ncbi:MAG: EamA family transporter [Pseudomonadota bacterium]
MNPPSLRFDPMKPWEVGLAVLISLVWGVSFVAIQIGVNSFPPLFFSAIRFALAAIPLVFFLPPPKVSWKLVLSIGFTLGVVKFSLLFVGMHVGLSAGLASLLLQAQVFLTLVLAALLLGEHPSSRQSLGIFLAFCGIAIVAMTIDSSASRLGLALVLLAAMAWAVSNLLMHRSGSVKMLNLMVWMSLVPPLPLLLLSFALEGADWPAMSDVSWEGIWALIYVTLIGTVLGFAGWGFLLSRHGASRIAPFALLVPIFGMGSSALVFGETFGAARLAGATVVLLGLVLAVSKTNNPRSQMQ